MKTSSKRFGRRDRPNAGQAVGVILVLGMSTVSMVMNFRFGLMIAAGAERWLYAIAVVLLDGLKTVLLIFVAAHLSAGLRIGSLLRAVVGLIIWVGAVVFSLSCAIGLYAMAQDARSGGAEAAKAEHAELETHRERLRSRIDGLGKARIAEAVAGDLAAKKLSRVWDRTNGCTDATVEESRLFCAEIATLEAERLGAMGKSARDAELARLEGELSGVQDRLDAVDLGAVYSRIDAAAETVGAVVGVSAETVRTALAVLIGALIEGSAACGLFVVTGVRAVARRASETRGDEGAGLPTKPALVGDGVGPWSREALMRGEGYRVPATALYENYSAWAERRDIEPVSQTQFGRRLSMLGFRERDRRKNGVVYGGVALKPSAVTTD